MSRTVHIVDYGIGNLHSVSRAIEKAGGEPRLTGDADELLNAERIVLPGVGAFEPCISTLRQSGLVKPILEFAQSGRPFLGICVGMQLLFDYSLEYGRHEGLGLIAGHVAPIPPSDSTNTRKVPHIGWSPLMLTEHRASWAGTLLADVRQGESSVYFVHSFSCVPDNSDYRLADVDYSGYTICAAVKRENIHGFQFHPEKSGNVGLKLLNTFLNYRTTSN